eukprot:TRINITY_DN2382_c1_g1_i2.p1 TRINITY_DN2382_c1_g1~~TRINITY_DN2382_c1_g1_i2.p1  ORF type:complete len:446 (-),score=24.18 TRINITY_DN2382_c1_g1_i2:289-1626(-)
MTLATDADDSHPGLWVPEPHGINAVLFGWSVSASLSSLVLPLTVDSGSSYYWMINSECYDSYRDFVKYIFFPMCKGCIGAAEKRQITALRALLNLAGGWPISASIFATLAWLYDKFVREENHQPVCSLSSTNNRGNATLFADRTGKLLSQSAQLLTASSEQFSALQVSLSNAKQTNAAAIVKSSEYEQLRDDLGKFLDLCPKTEPSLFEDERDKYRGLELQELMDKCKQRGLEFCKPSHGQESVADRLGLLQDIKTFRMDDSDIEYLSEAIQKAQGSPSALNNVKSACSGKKHGCVGVKAFEALRSLGRAVLMRVCKSLRLKCDDGSKDWDDEMLALVLVTASGATYMKRIGTVPFGICTGSGANECVPNAQCVEADRLTGIKMCQCKRNFCYMFNEETALASCEKQTNEPEQLMSVVKVALDTNRVRIGSNAYHTKLAMEMDDT